LDTLRLNGSKEVAIWKISDGSSIFGLLPNGEEVSKLVMVMFCGQVVPILLILARSGNSRDGDGTTSGRSTTQMTLNL
jgi:hypothetical protein